MRTSRWIGASALAAATSVATLIACHAAPDPLGATAEGGIPAAVVADGAWGASECASCTFAACSYERSACQAEPGCARYLDCVDLCPTTSEGNPDPACVAGCPASGASAAETARLALEHCRTVGAATTCATCAAAQRRRHTNPLLTTYCADASVEASPGDTPTQTACRACASVKCCGPRATCLADPGCFAYQECLVGCGNDKGCQAACRVTYDASFANFAAYLSCSGVFCSNECGFGQDPCVLCTYASCGDEWTACQADHDCNLLGMCLGDCGSAETCVSACRAQYPGAISLFEQQILCVERRCPSCL